eukprot:SAG11_NODE_3222_length_2601_cov_9.871703_1_plen_464_part_00
MSSNSTLVVVACCPTVHYDAVAARCEAAGLVQAFKRGWETVEDPDDWLPYVDEWLSEWEAGVVTATITPAKIHGHSGATLVFLQGGACCDLELTRQRDLVNAIKRGTSEHFKTKVHVLEFDDFMEEYSADTDAAKSRAVLVPLNYYSGPSVIWTRDSQNDEYYPDSATTAVSSQEFHAENLSKRSTIVRCARQIANRGESSMLHTHGFTLAQSPTSMAYEDFYTHEKVTEVYFPEAVALLKQVTGAAHVLPFTYIVRSYTGQLQGRSVMGAEKVQVVAPTVHCDHSPESAAMLLEKLAEAPLPNDAFHQGKMRQRALSQDELAAARRSGRWSVVHVWRNVRDEPVRNIPLALCDWRSVRDGDLCRVSHHYYPAGREPYAQNFYARQEQRHAWHFFDGMVRDEALLFTTWSSERFKTGRSVGGSTVMHTAFVDPTAPPHAPDREAIDLRCVCIWDTMSTESSRL